VQYLGLEERGSDLPAEGKLLILKKHFFARDFVDKPV
jgi:hypothetical protein